MWKCEKCGTVNSNNFCEGCGAQIPAQRQGGNQIQSANNRSMGNQKPLHEGNGAFKGSQPKKGKIVLIIALIVLAVVVITVGAVLATTQFINRKTKTVVTPIEQTEEIADKDEEIVKGDEADDEKAGGKTEKDEPESEVKYDTYRNAEFGFYCAYPTNFIAVKTSEMNVMKQYESKDGTAVMTIRAAQNSGGIGIEDALSDFHSAFDGEVTYEASGSTWYAVSIKMGERALYRKLFMKNDNIYCMDFEMNMEDVDKYGPYIEYIEDNFRAY